MKNSKAIEKLLKGGSEEYNDYFFDVYIGVLESCLFKDPLIPLQLYDGAVKTLLKACNTPVQGIEGVEVSFDKAMLDSNQKSFLWEWVEHYLSESEELEEDLEQFVRLIDAHREQYNPEPQEVETIKVKAMQRHFI